MKENSITTVYNNLTTAIADVIGHPDCAGNIEYRLAQFLEGIESDCTGNPKRGGDPKPVTADHVRRILPGVFHAAHNLVAEEQDLSALPLAA